MPVSSDRDEVEQVESLGWSNNEIDVHQLLEPSERLPGGSGPDFRHLARFALPALLGVFIVVFSVLRPDTFATTGTLRTVVATQASLAVLALAAFVTLTIREFDLSIGAQLGLSALLVPGLTSRLDLPLPLAIAAGIAATATIGLFNGFLVAVVRINSFIATIAVSALVGAFVLWYSDGAPIFEGVPSSLLSISDDVGGVPLPTIYVIVIAAVLMLLAGYTTFGRQMAAVGGSREAARLSGVNTVLVTLVAFTIAGALAGAAGVITAGQLGTGNPAVGPGLLLPAFAAAFLGATSFKVGTFNVLGTMTAVLTIATGVAGLNLMGLPQWVDPAFNGGALLIAVIATRFLSGEAVEA